MEAAGRRERILEILNKCEQYITGAELARSLGVSRQVIVQDIALLRAQGWDIIATPQGYIMNQDVYPPLPRRIFACQHHDLEGLTGELLLIIDNGGKVLDVVVEHPLYGELKGNLMLSSRRDVLDFVRRLKKSGARPLAELTKGIHLHTIEAKNEKILDRIKSVLEEKGFLVDKS